MKDGKGTTNSVKNFSINLLLKSLGRNRPFERNLQAGKLVESLNIPAGQSALADSLSHKIFNSSKSGFLNFSTTNVWGWIILCWSFPNGSALKSSPAVQETQVQSLGREDSPGGGNGNPLQCSCLDSLMDRGAWRAAVHRVTKNWTQLSARAEA